MLALTDDEGNRRVRLGVDAAGVEDAMTWSTWSPWLGVRVDTVCWVDDGSCHGRVHRIDTGRRLTALETGFAVDLDGPDGFRSALEVDGGAATLRTAAGCSAILGPETVPPGVLALLDGISASTGSSESIGRDGGRDGPG